MQITASTPHDDATHKNSLLWGMSRRNSQVPPHQSAIRNSSVPSPIMTSHARCTVLTWLTVGIASGGNESRPWMTVSRPVLGFDSHEASPGIGIPPLTVPSSCKRPRIVSGTSLEVSATSSMAANFIGWLLKTQRANESPTPIWNGIAIAATVNGMINPRRWYRSRRPRSIPTA